ncbi:MAG: ABC transporter ATP-binding protein [Planctomycetota bacterium]
MIEVRGLSRWFGSTCAVRNLSLAVPAGSVLGFIGPNGAGKTTTMRILATLDEPDLGDALVDGFSVVDDADRVRSRIGYVPDAYGAYANVSCVEYLDFFARSYGLVGRQRMDAVNRVIEFTRMGHMLHKPMNGLSKGMKQRLCLGRALIHDPKVLILDEPAAGLDPRARIELKEMIGQLAAAGKSLLISSHILTELAEMCDRLAIIERGELLAEGPVEQILRGQAFAHQEPAEVSRVTLQVTLLGEAGPACEWLRSARQLEAGVIAEQILELVVADEPAEHAQLLRELVQAGFAVTRFTTKSRTLEEAFLKVTRGNVQ